MITDTKKKKKDRDNALLREKHEIALSNWSLLNEYDPVEFNCKHKKRVNECYSYYQMLKVINVLTNEEVKKNLAFHKCDLKYCPLCQYDLAKKWYCKLLPICETAKNQYFITLTWPNIYLADLVDKKKRIENILLFNCDNDFKLCGKAFTSLQKRNDTTKFFLTNCIRKSEDTINYFDKSYNFHWHLLCSVDHRIPKKDIADFEKRLSIEWTATFKKFFPNSKINTANGLLRVQIEQVKNNDINKELTAYVAKDCIKSFKKEDVIQDFALRQIDINKKIAKCKNEKKKRDLLSLLEYINKNLEALRNMTQLEITELNGTWLKFSKGMRVFNKSGFKGITEAEVNEYWNKYKFGSFQEYRNFNLISQCESELDFLYFQCLKVYSYNSKRKINLSKQEVVDHVFSKAKFQITIDKQQILNREW